MLRLILFRHAKSDHPANVADRDRPLAPRGRQEAPVIAAWMARQGLCPDLVVCSSSARTRETWSLAQGAFGSPPAVRYEDRIYEAPVGRLLEVISETAPDVGTLLLVGHNPGMGGLAATVLEQGEGAASSVATFPTAAVAVLELDIGSWQDIEAGCARLAAFVTPKTLAAAG